MPTTFVHGSAGVWGVGGTCLLPVSWPGFPAGGCGLEQHRPSIPQPFHRHQVELGSQVTGLGSNTHRGQGREGLPWPMWTRVQVPPLVSLDKSLKLCKCQCSDL